jgi:hypothetical protein
MLGFAKKRYESAPNPGKAMIANIHARVPSTPWLREIARKMA